MLVIDTEQKTYFFEQMHKLYRDIRQDIVFFNKYDKGNYFENYIDLCKLCTSLIRNISLDLSYLWTRDANDPEKFDVFSNDQNLDMAKVLSTSTDFGEVFPTAYTFSLAVVKCLLLIRDIRNVAPVDDYSQTPSNTVNYSLVNIHCDEILPLFNKILVERGEDGVSECNIDVQINDILNLLLLAVANIPNFRWATTDADVIKRILTNAKPIKELIDE